MNAFCDILDLFRLQFGIKRQRKNLSSGLLRMRETPPVEAGETPGGRYRIGIMNQGLYAAFTEKTLQRIALSALNSDDVEVINMNRGSHFSRRNDPLKPGQQIIVQSRVFPSGAIPRAQVFQFDVENGGLKRVEAAAITV